MVMPRALTEEDRAIWEWQLDVPGFGEPGQERLKGASVLVSRCGGLGSVVAYELAAAGVGRLVIPHGGNVKPSDLNRQLLDTHASIGTPRIDVITQRLLDLNPRLDVVPIAANIGEQNAEEIVGQCDVVVDCAPLFEERYAMNDAAMRQGKPMVDAAMYELQAQLTTLIPGETPSLRCIYPDPPAFWRRRFPVFGAVSGAVGCLAAMEAIKLIAGAGDDGLGETLAGRMLRFDLRDMSFRTFSLREVEWCERYREQLAGASDVVGHKPRM